MKLGLLIYDYESPLDDFIGLILSSELFLLKIELLLIMGEVISLFLLANPLLESSLNTSYFSSGGVKSLK